MSRVCSRPAELPSGWACGLAGPVPVGGGDSQGDRHTMIDESSEGDIARPAPAFVARVESPLGLTEMDLSDRSLFDAYFAACPTRLSDYSFANTYIWHRSLSLRWRCIRDALCVFANGTEGLTLLFPPLGTRDPRVADEAIDLCHAYNRDHNLIAEPRIEYAANDLAETLADRFRMAPMSGDYVYATARLIDLDGGDLAGKRQARNRFARRYQPRCEPFGPEHVSVCLELLDRWHGQHESTQVEDRPSDQPADAVPNTPAAKRAKEELATAEAIRSATALGLVGMVLYDADVPVGFTFGETLAADTCSILIEKTDRTYAGSAQYVFNEFCRRAWAGSTWCNVGDDWDVPSLAHTKQSYRPICHLDKWALHPLPRVLLTVEAFPAESPASVDRIGQADPSLPEPASLCDADPIARLEARCFDAGLAMNRRQVRRLLRCPRATTLVVRQDGEVIAEAVLLRRRTRAGVCGRLYSLGVAPERRGAGLGRLLVDQCLAILRAESARAVVLEVDAANQAAIALYERLGFRRTRCLRDYYGPGRHGWKMRADLR